MSVAHRARWIDAFPWIDRADQRILKGSESGDRFFDVAQSTDQIVLDTPATWATTEHIGNVLERNTFGMTYGELFPFIPESHELNPAMMPGVSTRQLEGYTHPAWREIVDEPANSIQILKALDVMVASVFYSRLARLNADFALQSTEFPLTVLPEVEDSWRAKNSIEVTDLYDAKENFGNLIEILANWIQVEGEPTKPLIQVIANLDGAPTFVNEAAEQLNTLTARSFGLDSEPAIAVFELLETFIASLDNRDKSILKARVLSVPKETLDAIGARLNVTRERVRQLEASIKARLHEWVASDLDFELQSQRIRSHIGDLCKLRTLLEIAPDLTELVEPFAQPAWFVFDQFDDSFESDGVWVATPGLNALSNRFDALFDEFAGVHHQLSIDEFAVVFDDWNVDSHDLLIEWAVDNGYARIGNSLVSPTIRSMHGRAIAALRDKGEPLTLEQMHQMVAPEKSIRSLANQLQSDPLVQKVGIDHYGLVEWGGAGYVSIRDEIRRRVDAAGSVALTTLLHELPAQFGVAESSVRIYASAWPFQIHDGRVSLATRPNRKPRPLHLTRNVLFFDGGFGYRFKVTNEHLRGAGNQFANPLSAALGVVPGLERSFAIAGTDRNLKISFTSPNATMSTIRADLLELGATLDDTIIVEFQGDDVCFHPIDATVEKPIDLIRNLLLIDGSEPVSRRSVAERIGMPTNSAWSELLEVLSARKEYELIEAITAYVTSHQQSTTVISAGEKASFVERWSDRIPQVAKWSDEEIQHSITHGM